MQCKFLEHGLAIGYDHVVKPCCDWTYDKDWAKQNHVNDVDLSSWHQSDSIHQAKKMLASGVWPDFCQQCKTLEHQGRQDSGRGNSLKAYADYQDQDITLEIRPGSVCNFACQTCWPEASSRVAQFYHQAGFINIESINSDSIGNFEFLLPVAGRIRNLVVLGGEPFYDPNCRKFLAWAQQNLSAEITMFTNGSHVDWSWVDAYSGSITMVFSLDAVGSAAEYVRFGTDWPVVCDNFTKAQQHPKIQLRVNVTTSVYNYHLIEDVIDFLIPQWPVVVSFGRSRQPHLCEVAVPNENRPGLIVSLERVINKLQTATIDLDQQHNAINTVRIIIDNLKQNNFDVTQFNKLRQLVKSLDQVKRISVVDSANPVNFA